MDRKLYRHDETIMAAEDELYQVGSSTAGTDLDNNLRGARAGDILKFNVEHPDPEIGEVTFQVLVKEVKEKILPEVTDEWALEAWELDSVEELRKDIRYQLEAVRKVENAFVMRGRVVEALVELVDEEIPEALVSVELEHRLRGLIQRVTKQGLDLGAWLQATGRTQEDVILELRNDSVAAAKLDLALRAVADLEGIEVSDEEIDAEIARLAEKTGKKAAADAPRARRRRPVARGTLGSQEVQGPGMAHRPDRVRRRGGSTRRPLVPVPAGSRPRARGCRRSAGHSSRSRGPMKRSVTSRSTTTWSPPSSSRRTAGSGPSTSTPGCSRSASSSWARRSTTPSPT